MPKKSERVLGGHAVLAVGFNDKQKRFIVRNSWGPGWGLQGYFTMPYAYLTNPQLVQRFLDGAPLRSAVFHTTEKHPACSSALDAFVLLKKFSDKR